MEPIIPKTTLIKVGGALIALLGLTVAFSYADLGMWGLMIALAIALAKAVLVLLFFMELRYSEHLNWIFAVSGFFWLLILLVGTFSDFLSRTHVRYG